MGGQALLPGQRVNGSLEEGREVCLSNFTIGYADKESNIVRRHREPISQKGGDEQMQMKRLLLLAVMLGAFMAADVYATPQPLDVYGGYDPTASPTWWYLTDYYGYNLEDGDCVAAYWKGPNGVYDGIDTHNAPNALPDDSLLVLAPNGIEYGGFYFTVTTWGTAEGHPAPCEEIYIVIYDSSCAELSTSNYYGVSQQHHCENFLGELMYAHFPGEQTDTPLPVELMSFVAVGGDREVQLTWKTASENACEGFHIERSVDEVTFERITEEIIPGAGHSTTENTYTYLDRNLINGTSYYYNLIVVDMDGLEQVANESSLAATPTAHMPTKFALYQNSPNPFNPVTEIKYELPKDVHVTLKVYNVLGAEVATLVDAPQEANFYTVHWDAKDLASGVYFCSINAGDFKAIKKMVLLK
jgi:hypothetical protein